MRLTPLDLQNHVFRSAWRGYEPGEVDAFLRMVAEDLEGLVRENERLRERILELEGRVEQMGAREDSLRETLVTAQTVSDDLKRTASKEAEVLLAEAEVKAEKVLDAAHRRVARLAEEIREMRTLRTRLAASVRSAIETHLALLDGLSAELPEEPLLDGKVAFLARGAAAAARPAAPPAPAKPALPKARGA